MSVPNIAEIKHAIYQGRSTRRMRKKTCRKKTRQGLICAEIMPLHVLSPYLSPR